MYTYSVTRPSNSLSDVRNRQIKRMTVHRNARGPLERVNMHLSSSSDRSKSSLPEISLDKPKKRRESGRQAKPARNHQGQNQCNHARLRKAVGQHVYNTRSKASDDLTSSPALPETNYFGLNHNFVRMGQKIIFIFTDFPLTVFCVD